MNMNKKIIVFNQVFCMGMEGSVVKDEPNKSIGGCIVSYLFRSFYAFPYICLCNYVVKN